MRSWKLAALAAACLAPAMAAGAAETFQDCSDCPEMAVIPAGSFVMGSPETEAHRGGDEGRHAVTFDYDFAVAATPITWDQWEACARDGACDGPGVEAALRTGFNGEPIADYVDHGRGSRPAVGLSWWDAQAYVGWLAARTGRPYRLLSESEFEYAARGGTDTVFWWGDEPSHDYANYGLPDGEGLGGDAEGRDVWVDHTSPVGSFPANPFGLYDMNGNIYQWIEDCYEPDAAKLPADGSAQKDVGCATRGMRSNSFESNPETMRTANRAFPYTPITRGRNYLGARVALTLD